MSKELAELRKKNMQQLDAELISVRAVSYTHLTLPTTGSV